ncbi:hypothetical protein BDR22DRAFT_400960 [Usnea florida]
MILDFKLWETGDLAMRRLVTFAAQHPDLAKLVHGLQLQFPPLIGFDDPVGERARCLGDFGEFSLEQKSAIRDITVTPLEKWRLAQSSALSDASISTRDTFRSLPNLYHVEPLLSIQDQLTTGTLESDILNKTGVHFDCNRLLRLRPSLSFDRAFTLIIPHINSPIKSLKLPNVSFSLGEFLQKQGMPAMLEHLDLELLDLSCFPQRSSFELLAGIWRGRLAALQRLTTLRLRWAEVRHTPFYIDDLLIDPADSTKTSIFPQLKCFSVSGGCLRVNGLVAFATLHAPTLQEFELNRVIFDPSYCPESWSEISALCKSVLPNLTYLRLSKLVTHFPQRLHTPPGSAPISGSGDPVQEHWNPGLEATTAYEWRKGINGPDREVKGPRCPWEAKDVITTEVCKERFNSDRVWHSIYLGSSEIPNWAVMVGAHFIDLIRRHPNWFFAWQERQDRRRLKGWR